MCTFVCSKQLLWCNGAKSSHSLRHDAFPSKHIKPTQLNGCTVSSRDSLCEWELLNYDRSPASRLRLSLVLYHGMTVQPHVFFSDSQVIFQVVAERSGIWLRCFEVGVVAMLRVMTEAVWTERWTAREWSKLSCTAVEVLRCASVGSRKSIVPEELVMLYSASSQMTSALWWF